jgi:hypothetical protein
MSGSVLRKIYRLSAGALGLVSVGAQYWLIVHDKSGAAFLTGTINFLSYFSILTSLLAAAAMLFPVLLPGSRLGRFFERASVRTAISGYIIIVGAVYFLLLRNIGHAEGWSLFFDHILHYVLPPLFVLDWILFVPKGVVAWRNGFACLGFPALYIAWTLSHGALTGWYPYYFVNVSQLGYAQSFLNIAGLVLAFLALDFLLVAIDRVKPNRPA